MFYITIPEFIKRKDPLFMYGDTATTLKSARAKAYALVKSYPNSHVYVLDADPCKSDSAAYIIKHRRGWAWKVGKITYWTVNGMKASKLKSDGSTIKE